METRKFVAVLVPLLTLSLIALGCAPAAAPTAAPAPTSAPAATATTAKKEKTLVYVTPSLGVPIDPELVTGEESAEVIQMLYGAMTYYKQVQLDPQTGIWGDDTASGEGGMVGGALESWEISPDGKVYTFHVRKNWFDFEGNPMTANDIKWTLDRMRGTKSGSTYLVDACNIMDPDQVKVIDDYTLQVTLPAPNPICLRVLNVNGSSPMSKTMALKHATKDDPWASEWMRSNAPGAGPYMLESWTPGVEQVFVKNPGWYKGGAFPEPDIDRIIYRQVPESANRVALLMSGEAQIGRAFTMDEIDKLEKAPGVKVWCYAGNKFVWGGLNYELDPTKNPKLREALAYATPYQDILSAVYKGKAKPLYGYVTDTYGGFLGKDAFPYKTDYEKAKALLAEAGYPKGLDLTLSMSDNWPLHERIAVLLKDSYAKIGVNLSIQKKPAAAFKDDIFSRKAAFFLDEDYSFVLDPNYAAFVFLAKCNPPCWNTNGFRDEEFWATMDKARAMRDSPERTALMQWLQKRFYEDTPWIPVANVPTCFVTSDKVTGYHFHTNNQMYFFDLKLQQ